MASIFGAKPEVEDIPYEEVPGEDVKKTPVGLILGIGALVVSLIGGVIYLVTRKKGKKKIVNNVR